MAKLIDTENEYLSKKFTRLNLTYEEISHRDFEDCTFSECDFSEATFSSCRFLDCHFIKCNLSVTKIGSSKFSGVTFDACKMVGIDWTLATWPTFELPSPLQFIKCILNDSSFFGLSLPELVMEECKAHDVDFREGNFSEANFTYTDLANSMFNQTNLRGADFTDAINYNIDIYHNDIKQAKFTRVEAVRLLESIEIKLID